jgi:hypothetical protein
MKKGMTILLGATILAFFVAVFSPTGKHGDAMRREFDRFQLRSLGLSCRMYAEDHGGRFPEDWLALLRYMNTNGVYFGTAGKPKKPAVFADIMQRTDAVYVQGATTSSPSETVVAFLPPGHYRKYPEAIVLYVDGDVRLQSPDVFAKTVKDIPKQTVLPIPAHATQADR